LKDVISDERLEKALRYLARTDMACALAKAEVARAEYRIKLARSAGYFASEERTVESRKMDAERSPLMEQAEGSYATALVAFEQLRAKRETESIIVETWRSLNANRRSGNV